MKTTEQFIIEAREIHGEQYDYSKSNYIGSVKHLTITCPKHGDWEIKPNNHISGKRGCKQCGWEKRGNSLRKSQPDFIRESLAIQEEVYNYDKVDYRCSKTKVTITCEKHGDFSQLPLHHLKGHGCPACGRIKCEAQWNAVQKEEAKENFIRKAKERHGDKFSYEKTVYVDAKTKLIVICPIHGEIETLSNNHLISDCDLCSNKVTGNKLRSNTETFVKRCIEVHGDKYDYSKVDYISTVVPVIIICSKHGEFLQTPNKHLYSARCCPRCSESSGERAIAEYLTNNSIIFESEKRFDTCRNILPLPFDFFIRSQKLLIEYQGIQHFQTVKTDFFGGEKELIKRQQRDRIKREWVEESEYTLLEITYLDNIEEILKTLINSHQMDK